MSACRRFCVLALFCSVVITSVSIFAQQNSRISSPRASGYPAYLADVRTFDMDAAPGRTYQISVALPYGYDPKSSPYAVVYAADANVAFGSLVETLRLMGATGEIPQTVVVGIGYDSPHSGFGASFAARALDLTPLESSSDLASLRAIAKTAGLPEPTATGGAGDFLGFIVNKAIPYVERNYNVSRSDRTWYGHSYGGLFGVYAMLHSPGLFQRLVLGSPTLDFARGYMLNEEENYSRRHRNLPESIYMAVGTEEEETDDPMVSDMVRFIAQLQSHKYSGLQITSEVFNGETHTSVMMLSIVKGFRSVYKSPVSGDSPR